MLVAGAGRASRCCSTSSSRRPGAAPTARAGAELVAGRRLLRRRRPGVPRRRRVGRRRTACPAGICAASRALRAACRSPTLAAPAAALARDGRRRSTRQQAYVFEILDGILTPTPECAAIFAPEGRAAGRGRASSASPSSADTLERLGARGRARRSTRGDDRRGRRRAAAPSSGGLLTAADLAAYEVDRARAGARRATAGATC